MLTQHDISMMESQVIEILELWGDKATILIPKPEVEQPNWNPLMREYTGDIAYDMIENVPTERLDVVNEYTIADMSYVKAGNKAEASILYKFPTVFNGKSLIITSDMIFMFNNDTEKKYHVNTIRQRIGETIVDVDLITGGTDSGW